MSKTEKQSEALRLAETLEIYGHRGTQKAAAELRRLDARVKSLEFSFNEWHDKTDWVQDTAQALELGMHRADVLRARIEALDAENKALRAQLDASPKAAPTDAQVALLDPWMRPAAARELLTQVLAIGAPAVDASDDTALLDFLQQTATAVEVLAQDEGEPPRFLVNRAISKDVRSAIRMARGKAHAARAAAKTGDAA